MQPRLAIAALGMEQAWAKGKLVGDVSLKLSRSDNRPPRREKQMMSAAQVNNGPKIERGIGLLADFHGRPMINFRSQQNAFGNLALRHHA